MIRQIVIQAEPYDDAKSMFRLSIDSLLIAKGVTVGQACYLVSEILGRIGAQDAETMTFEADDDANLGCETEGEPETLEVQAASVPQGGPSWVTSAVSSSTGTAARRSS